MASEAAYADPGTDSHPPVEDIVAPWEPAVFVWLDGITHCVHEFARVRARIPASQTAPPQSERAIAKEISPRLSAETEAAITELMKLPLGWDGYDGLPVQPEVAGRARRFMAAIGEYTPPVPDVVPLSDGGLQLEWFVGAYEVEVVIAPDGTAHIYFECINDGRILEFPLDDSFNIELIAPFFRELRQ